ncbi:hypothetical protein EHF33_15815 [Deinococcus psychrotolerans]|uniref:Uncharacterized protein n=1 Tax=Deinococcus psychrotolerans TaxID=2489213 RepID=A0A3G8YG81_9DEIO|nr:hypothetical protein [Deinococcus psychrotolerans]AZI44349.1 hypothetical protein EHF33_15815 [Deinococcus psychrotolerans]
MLLVTVRHMSEAFEFIESVLAHSPDNCTNIPDVVIKKSADCRGRFDSGQLGERLALTSQKEVHHDLERLAVLLSLKC